MRKRFFRMLFTAAVLLAPVLWPTAIVADPQAQDATLTQLEQALEQAATTYAGMATYTADVILRERHKGKIQGDERIRAALAKSPLRLHFTWKKTGIYGGLQAAYDAKRDGPDHYTGLSTGASGLLGVRRWHVHSKVIKKLYPHHFPMNQYHMGFMLGHMREMFDKARAAGKIQARILAEPPARAAGRNLIFYAIELSADPADGLLYRRALIGAHPKTSLPLFIELYGFDDRLWGNYDFVTLHPNVKIDPSEFTLKD